MDNKGYITSLNQISNPYTWGAYMSGAGTIEGQPFSWAQYICLGNTQIAYTDTDGNKIALRLYVGGTGTWGGWAIIPSA